MLDKKNTQTFFEDLGILNLKPSDVLLTRGENPRCHGSVVSDCLGRQSQQNLDKKIPRPSLKTWVF